MKQCYSRTSCTACKDLGSCAWHMASKGYGIESPNVKKPRSVILHCHGATPSTTEVPSLTQGFYCHTPDSHSSSRDAVEKIKFTGRGLRRACSCLFSETVIMEVTGTLRCSRTLEFQGVCSRVATRGSISLLCFKNHYRFPVFQKGQITVLGCI